MQLKWVGIYQSHQAANGRSLSSAIGKVLANRTSVWAHCKFHPMLCIPVASNYRHCRSTTGERTIYVHGHIGSLSSSCVYLSKIAPPTIIDLLSPRLTAARSELITSHLSSLPTEPSGCYQSSIGSPITSKSPLTRTFRRHQSI